MFVYKTRSVYITSNLLSKQFFPGNNSEESEEKGRRKFES